MTEPRNQFLCTRPRVASELIRLGYPATITAHPWKPNLTAWLFDLTDDLRRDAVNIYTAMELAIPQTLREEAQA